MILVQPFAVTRFLVASRLLSPLEHPAQLHESNGPRLLLCNDPGLQDLYSMESRLQMILWVLDEAYPHLRSSTYQLVSRAARLLQLQSGPFSVDQESHHPVDLAQSQLHLQKRVPQLRSQSPHHLPPTKLALISRPHLRSHTLRQEEHRYRLGSRPRNKRRSSRGQAQFYLANLGRIVRKRRG